MLQAEVRGAKIISQPIQLLSKRDEIRVVLRENKADQSEYVNSFTSTDSNLTFANPRENFQKNRNTKSIDNRNFLLQLAHDLDIQKPSDWGLVTFKEFTKRGGAPVLRRYGFSISKALQANFPGFFHFLFNVKKQFGTQIGSEVLVFLIKRNTKISSILLR